VAPARNLVVRRTPDRRHFVVAVAWCYCYCCGRRTLINSWASGGGDGGIRVDFRPAASRTRDAPNRRGTSVYVLRICAKHGVPLPGSDPERRVYRLLLDNGRVLLLVAALRGVSFFSIGIVPSSDRPFPLPLITPELPVRWNAVSKILYLLSADGVVFK